MGRIRVLGAAAAVVIATAGCSWVGRVGLSSTGAQPGGGITTGSDVSPTGRFVVFTSSAENLVPNDTNASDDVFLRDNQAGTTERISISDAEKQASLGGYGGLVSSDGRYVAFNSDSENLLATNDTNQSTDVFLRDRTLGTTTRMSVRNGGTQSDGPSYLQSITPDAGVIVFASDAENLIGTADQNYSTDIYIRDRVAAKTVRVSVGTDGSEGDLDSSFASISDNGRYVAFVSNASNFDINDSGVFADVFVRDRTLSTTTRLTGFPDGDEADGDSYNVAISGDGSTVVFDTDATNLIGTTDQNDTTDVYAVKVATGAFERISVAANGGDPDDFSVVSGLSDDGRYVLFQSGAKNLTGATLKALSNSFLRDRTAGTTVLAGNTQTQAEPSNADPTLAGSSPNGISGDGRYILFSSSATDVMTGADANGTAPDVFLRSNPVPFIFATSAPTLTRGTTVNITLTGKNLHTGSVVLPGQGITVNTVNVVSDTQINLNVTIAANADLGPRTPLVIDPGTGGPPLSGGLAFFPALYNIV
ncbi:MAG: hypothetical protein ABJC79_02045 [Acidimicrobiia bacterium]